MAAAALPLIAAAAPPLINLIAGLVHKSAPQAESQLGAKTGPVKFAQVFQDVMTALQQAAAAGQIDKALPSDQTVQVVIQAVIASMQLSGLLTAPPVSTTGPVPVILASGQTLTVQAK